MGDGTGPVVKTVTVNVDEIHTRGVTVSKTNLEVTEGQSNTYSIALESDPVGGPVTVTISSSSDDVTVKPSQLNFTTGGAAETVTVSAIGDDDAESNPSATLSHTVRGGDYNNIGVGKVTVAVREKDTRALVISDLMSAAGATLTEGESGTYTVKLGSQPTGTVTVQVRSDSDDLTVRPSQLKFTTSDWNTAQTVRVRAEHDDDAEDDPVVTLRYTASGGGYNGISENVRVTIEEIEEDDNVAPVGARARPKSLTIEEGGSTSYTLVLLAQPTGTVRVQVDVGPDVRTR